MVVFTCNHCGETLHKPKVEKHYQFQCRNYKSVTCVDCFKDFRNEEYVVHTKCITEDERYAAKGTYKNGIVKKGEVKQESWLEMIRSICDKERNLKPSLKNLLNIISGNSNVPRKKIKFLNFVKSSLGGRVNMNDVEEVWNLIEKYKTVNSNNTKEQEMSVKSTDKIGGQNCSLKRSNDSNEKEEKIVKKAKYIENSNNDTNIVQNNECIKKNKESEEDAEVTPVRFNFKEKILEIVTTKKEISIKKLQKRVLKAYCTFVGDTNIDENVVKKFNKKLKKIPTIKIENESVIFKGDEN